MADIPMVQLWRITQYYGYGNGYFTSVWHMITDTAVVNIQAAMVFHAMIDQFTLRAYMNPFMAVNLTRRPDADCIDGVGAQPAPRRITPRPTATSPYLAQLPWAACWRFNLYGFDFGIAIRGRKFIGPVQGTWWDANAQSLTGQDEEHCQVFTDLMQGQQSWEPMVNTRYQIVVYSPTLNQWARVRACSFCFTPSMVRRRTAVIPGDVRRYP